MRSLRHVFRRFGHAPMFASIAVVTLALGIGANTAIFSVVNGVLIKPLAYSEAQQLVGALHPAPGVSGITSNLNCSPTMYFTYREESRTFEEFGLWLNDGVTVTGAGESGQIAAFDFTYGTLQRCGFNPRRGRWFSQADDTPGAPDTVILTYGYWQRHFEGDPASTVGRALIVDSKPHVVVGVMPPDFGFLNSRAELILPQQFDRNKGSAAAAQATSYWSPE